MGGRRAATTTGFDAMAAQVRSVSRTVDLMLSFATAALSLSLAVGLGDRLGGPDADRHSALESHLQTEPPS